MAEPRYIIEDGNDNIIERGVNLSRALEILEDFLSGRDPFGVYTIYREEVADFK